jgi:hypothetical protein
MIDKNKVLSIVKEKGPVLPRDVVKEVGSDTFMVGAILSQLAEGKQIKISYAKIGGSPVYYVLGQEEKLDTLYKYLHEKEKKAYDTLKEQKIIRDSTAEPVLRVALRNIRDFAKPLEVNLKGKREIFWKWYLLSNTAAEQIIRENLKSDLLKESKKRQEEHEAKKEEKQGKITKDKEADTKFQEGQGILEKVKKVFKERQIDILETKIIRKKTDLEMIVKIPSAVGMIKYFCKIRDKKKSNDKDLSAAYVQGQMKKLPVLYVTTGDLTKKAQEMLKKEFKIVAVLQI